MNYTKFICTCLLLLFIQVASSNIIYSQEVDKNRVSNEKIYLTIHDKAKWQIIENPYIRSRRNMISLAMFSWLDVKDSALVTALGKPSQIDTFYSDSLAYLTYIAITYRDTLLLPALCNQSYCFDDRINEWFFCYELQHLSTWYTFIVDPETHLIKDYDCQFISPTNSDRIIARYNREDRRYGERSTETIREYIKNKDKNKWREVEYEYLEKCSEMIDTILKKWTSIDTAIIPKEKLIKGDSYTNEDSSVVNEYVYKDSIMGFPPYAEVTWAWAGTDYKENKIVKLWNWQKVITTYIFQLDDSSNIKDCLVFTENIHHPNYDKWESTAIWRKYGF